MRARGQSTVGHRDDRRVSVTVLGEPGRAWPSSPWANTACESAPAHQPRRWSKTNSGTGAGASSELATGSGAWSHGGGPRAPRERKVLRERLARLGPDPDGFLYWVFLDQLNDFKQNNDVKTPNDGTATLRRCGFKGLLRTRVHRHHLRACSSWRPVNT